MSTVQTEHQGSKPTLHQESSHQITKGTHNLEEHKDIRLSQNHESES